MKVIMPLAGNGQRFFDEGYELPKPLIDINGIPMFKRVINNLGLDSTDKDLNFIIQEQHAIHYQLDVKIRDYYPHCNIIMTPGLTDGAATTVRLATNVFNSNQFVVANCDQLMVWDKNKLLNLIDEDKWKGGIIPCFKPKHNQPIHSYVKVNENNEVIDLKEKELISNIATVGVYYFNNETQWCSAYEDMKSANDKTNNEYYLAPTYNYLKEKSTILMVDEMIGMGTPAELDLLKNSEWWDKLDEIS